MSPRVTGLPWADACGWIGDYALRHSSADNPLERIPRSRRSTPFPAGGGGGSPRGRGTSHGSVPSYPNEHRGEMAALAALALLTVALVVSPITNNDIFLHLRTGATVLATGHVPRVDDYSALARGRPFIAHEWLAGVVFRLAEIAAGLDGPIVLKALIALLCAAALYGAARALGASPAVAIPALAFVMILAAARIMERPHIFSYLLTALFLLLLARRRAGGRVPLWTFLPIQVVWANLHGGFILGPTIVALAAAGEGLESLIFSRAPGAPQPGSSGAPPHRREATRVAGLAVSLVAACLLNPYGVALLKFPFQLTGSSFMGEIWEWQPPFASDFAGTYMMREYVAWGLFGLAIHALTLVRVARRRAAPPGGAFPVLLFVVLLALSLRMQRNVTDFGLGTFPGVAAGATWLLPAAAARRGGRACLAGITLLLLGLAVWFAWSGYPFRPSSRRSAGFGVGFNIPVAGADYLGDNGVRGNAFNTYTTGAYLVYRFYPQVRVAMDSRNDVYGADLYREYKHAATDPKALAAFLKRIDASFVFLDWTLHPVKATLEGLRKIGGWRLVYFDDVVVILVRQDGPFAALAARDGYTLVDPASYRPGTIPPDRAPLVLEEATRAERQSHGALITRVMRENALLALGRRAEALDEEKAIIAADPPFPLHFIFTYLGILRYSAGDLPEAATHFRHALALNHRDKVAAEGLRRSSLPP